MGKRDLLSILDLGAAAAERLIRDAIALKTDFKEGTAPPLLAGKTLGLLFQKPSTRTRISFQVAMAQLGGTAVAINPEEIQLKRGETLEDTARVLSRYLDGLVVRTFAQAELEEWARCASIPVINGLSDFSHPCQILADLMTIREKAGRIRGLRIAYIGDGNNVAHSWLLAAGLLDLDLVLAVPPGFEPDAGVLRESRRRFGGRGEGPRVTADPAAAATDADVLYTDVWTSMGQEKERARRRRAFRGFQIDRRLLGLAKRGAVVMHCLPAHRGEEIAAEVLGGPQSVVLDQAENRLHLQKALLVALLAPRTPAARGAGGGRRRPRTRGVKTR